MDKRILLSTLWIFLTVNFIFCDVFGLHDVEYLKAILNGSTDGLQMTQEFILLFSIIMEIPMAMILVSRFLTPKYNRILNMIFGILLAIIQVWSLTVGTDATLYYWFFSIIEIAICISIVWIALKWKNSKPVTKDIKE